MRRLREQQTVQLDLEGESQAITCRVASVTGAVATLIADGTPLRSVELRSGAPGYLVFRHDGKLVALRGIAASVGNQAQVEFVVTDGVVLPERRTAERVQLATRARVWPRHLELDQTAGVETVTVDLSLDGALIEIRAGLDQHSQFALELFPDQHRTPIRCRARVTRHTPSHLAVKFSDLADADRTRLAIAVDRQQRAAA
jgi:hypothetical protein